ncbi:WbqC family protein [Anaeroarcus burkinensis]|uniref:WbqC family protein n=1 Tax=Anaeroarcus burkinensis TaxID=82376 RepID=UPI0004065CDD|nr:WbqC family protein [Anaeroarcus burkinensis]
MNKVAIHQSQYIPWAPYLKKIVQADLFVVMDNVQYQKNGVQNRNMVRNKQGEFWLTIPVTGNLTDTILEKRLAGMTWQKKHWKSISLAYSKAPFWNCYKEELEQLYGGQYNTLYEVNQAFLSWMMRCLGITTPVVRMSELRCQGNKSELVLSICQCVNAEVYLSGNGGKAYLDEESFRQANIEVEYLSAAAPIYEQVHGEFIGGLSVLDMMFNVDAKKIEAYLLGEKE